MTKSYYDLKYYTRFNMSESRSDIQFLTDDYKNRIKKLAAEDVHKSLFISFASGAIRPENKNWLDDNEDRFLTRYANETFVKEDYLAECGYIFCMLYSADGSYVLTGHSSGMIQIKQIVREYATSTLDYYKNEQRPYHWYPMFYEGKLKKDNDFTWIQENNDRFLKGTKNEMKYYRWFFSEMGAITALTYSPNGTHVIVGHSSGMIQMRHGGTGTVLHTLRSIQFPPKPIYALRYSRTDERICYASCMDGAIYRVEIPQLVSSVDDPPPNCIRTDPALECLNQQFYGAPGASSNSTPMLTQRFPSLCLGLTADGTKIVVGYGDTSIKIWDLETETALITYKVHKLRLQYIPKKLQRMHSGQVCAMSCHEEKPFMFASAAWDNTLRIWDTRCKVGCMMTFEGVQICSDSLDLNRNICLTGSWQPTEALSTWDLVAKKRISVIRVQNRRPDVDGEYIYACRFWHSTSYNRKGKYAIIGGSGTNCVEVINLHNRYITCSYPAPGVVLAITSYQDRIAYGGTATTFNIVKFYDPKHEKEKYTKSEAEDFDYAHAIFEDTGIIDDATSVNPALTGPEQPFLSPDMAE